MRWFWMWLLTISLMANPLEAELLAQLKKTGETEFSAVELALIASGAETPETLKAYVAKYQEFLDQIGAQAKEGNSVKKQAKNLHVALFKVLGKHDESNASLMDLLDDKVYSSVTATFVFTDLANQAGVKATSVETPLHAYTLIVDGDKEMPVENTGKSGFNMKHMKTTFPNFILDEEIVLEDEKEFVNLDYAFEHTIDTQHKISRKQLAAALFLKKAKFLGADQAEAIAQAVSLHTALAPESIFGKGYYDGHFFTLMHACLKDQKPLQGLEIGIPVAKRFPEVENFCGLLFNLGMLYFQNCDAKGDYADAIAMGEKIRPFLGPHREKFTQPMSMLYFNEAVGCFQKGDYEKAIELAEKVEQPHDINALNTLKGEAHAAWLDQMDKKGAFPQALALAAENLADEKGVNNYLIVLNHYHESLMNKGDFETCFKTLEEAPEQIRNSEVAENLRYNIYVAWLQHFERRDFDSTIPIYETLFADEGLNLKPEERESFEKNFAAMLAMRVQHLINEAQYDEAREKLDAAKKRFPKDENLKSIEENLTAILKRLNQ